jgi:hypothetical protein
MQLADPHDKVVILGDRSVSLSGGLTLWSR